MCVEHLVLTLYSIVRSEYLPLKKSCRMEGRGSDDDLFHQLNGRLIGPLARGYIFYISNETQVIC
jgi:hypothetical protein